MTGVAGDQQRETRDLIQRCIDGDGEAWHRMAGRYTPILAAKVRMVFARNLRRVPDPAELDGAVQEVFVRLFRNRARALKAFAWRSSFDAYISVIAASAALDMIRRDAARRAPFGRRVDAEVAYAVVPDPAEDAADGMLSGESREILRRHLEALPQKERLALVMRFWHGAKPPAIARAMGVSPDSVRDWIERALERLKRRMS